MTSCLINYEVTYPETSPDSFSTWKVGMMKVRSPGAILSCHSDDDAENNRYDPG